MCTNVSLARPQSAGSRCHEVAFSVTTVETYDGTCRSRVRHRNRQSASCARILRRRRVKGREIGLAARREPVAALQRLGQTERLEAADPNLVRGPLLADLGGELGRYHAGQPLDLPQRAAASTAGQRPDPSGRAWYSAPRHRPNRSRRRCAARLVDRVRPGRCRSGRDRRCPCRCTT